MLAPKFDYTCREQIKDKIHISLKKKLKNVGSLYNRSNDKNLCIQIQCSYAK